MLVVLISQCVEIDSGQKNKKHFQIHPICLCYIKRVHLLPCPCVFFMAMLHRYIHGLLVQMCVCDVVECTDKKSFMSIMLI